LSAIQSRLLALPLTSGISYDDKSFCFCRGGEFGEVLA
jgi:hypothetical protein